MATINERALLKKKYPSKEFAKRVDKMSNAQVIAIVRRLQSKNQI